MKKILPLISFCIIGLFSCQQNEQPKDLKYTSKESAITVAEEFFTALGTGDTTLMRRVLASDFEMFEHDVIWNADSLLALMPNTLNRKWSVRDVSVTQSGDLVHLSYFNQGIVPADRSWFESMLLKSTDQGLKIKFMHSTKLYLK